jgi:pyruvate/2-oxoglutarate dehydrogenase complex dihydrolipoamide acyltransferase (E2) component
MMPALSPFMTEGTITKWLKKEGESFDAGDVLLQIESDIASLDVQAEMPGVLGKILIPGGTSNVPVEQVLAVVTGDAQDDHARLRSPARLRPIPPPLNRLDLPPTPIRGLRSGYPELPTPISATFAYQGPSPRLPESPKTSNPALRRPSLHFHHPSRLEPSQSTASFLHSATHRSPTATTYDSPTGGELFMHTNAHQGGTASVREMIVDHHQTACPSAGLGVCESGSTVGCEASQSYSRAEVEAAGQDLRRKILANFSKGPSMDGNLNGII